LFAATAHQNYRSVEPAGLLICLAERHSARRLPLVNEDFEAKDGPKLVAQCIFACDLVLRVARQQVQTLQLASEALSSALDLSKPFH
jgi:hypothetical protein